MDDLLKDLTPQVLGALVRHYGDFEMCEDAVQEALLDASRQWPREGLPDHPKGWLIRVASRRRTELWRNETARRRREEAVAAEPHPPGADERDDTLLVLMMCCHPDLTEASQIALTLRAVGGLTTAEIARALLVPEATVAQRISRAKQRIRGAEFSASMDRLPAVLHVLYLIFNEGYTASEGPELSRAELTKEAIRLTRQLRTLLPEDTEVAGLLALMLLTDARRPARTDAKGLLVPLAEQDRSLWNGEAVAEGVELVTWALSSAPIGPYQVQAAIAAVHDEAADAKDTDWVQILGLYELLTTLAPGPMVTLNRVVAHAMVHGPEAGLDLLEDDGHYRVAAVKAHLLELAGDVEAARDLYKHAAKRTLSLPERRYLESRALAPGPGGDGGEPG